MPIRPQEYEIAVRALEPVLANLPGKLVAIDGRDGAGKTSLGRFLAWYFNVTLIETDLFLQDAESMTYRYEEIGRVVSFRVSQPRPVIVEGIALLRILGLAHCKPDYLVYVRNRQFGGGHGLSRYIASYEQEFSPETNADLTLELAHETGG